ncbi:MAG: hypothetical protein ACE5DL_05775 [Nitrosopumilaceae archaeon]
MTQKPSAKTVVLRTMLDEDEASVMVNQKKTSIFKSMLKKPKKEEVHVNSITLLYECMLMVSGNYIADYYRKSIHTISVDSNVKETILGDGVFPIKKKSGFKRAFIGNRGKNKIDLPMEEHVFVEKEETMVFDYNGNEINFPFKINSKTIENYPDRILSENLANIKKLKITFESAIKLLRESLKKPLESDIRKLNEELIVNEITQIYVPVYEARLSGPKNKVGLIRLDAVRKKIL